MTELTLEELLKINPEDKERIRQLIRENPGEGRRITCVIFNHKPIDENINTLVNYIKENDKELESRLVIKVENVGLYRKKIKEIKQIFEEEKEKLVKQFIDRTLSMMLVYNITVPDEFIELTHKWRKYSSAKKKGRKDVTIHEFKEVKNKMSGLDSKDIPYIITAKRRIAELRELSYFAGNKEKFLIQANKILELIKSEDHNELFSRANDSIIELVKEYQNTRAGIPYTLDNIRRDAERLGHLHMLTGEKILQKEIAAMSLVYLTITSQCMIPQREMLELGEKALRIRKYTPVALRNNTKRILTQLHNKYKTNDIDYLLKNYDQLIKENTCIK